MNKTILFTYGTLKRGQCRNYYLKNQTFLGEAKTKPKYNLYSNGSYPCMITVEEDGAAIPGEIWEIDDVCLAALDRMEGHPILFKRDLVELEGSPNFGRMDFASGAITYFWNNEIEEDMQRIDEWLKPWSPYGEDE